MAHYVTSPFKTPTTPTTIPPYTSPSSQSRPPLAHNLSSSLAPAAFTSSSEVPPHVRIRDALFEIAQLAEIHIEVRINPSRVAFLILDQQSQTEVEELEEICKSFPFIEKTVENGGVLWVIRKEQYSTFLQRIPQILESLKELKPAPFFSPNHVYDVPEQATAASKVASNSYSGQHYVLRKDSAQPNPVAQILTIAGEDARHLHTLPKDQTQSNLQKCLESFSNQFNLALEIKPTLSTLHISCKSADEQERCENFFAIFPGIIKSAITDGKVSWEIDSSQYENFISRLNSLDTPNTAKTLSVKALIDLAEVFNKGGFETSLDFINEKAALEYKVVKCKEHCDIFISSEIDNFPLIRKAQGKGFGKILPCLARSSPYRQGIRLTYNELIQLEGAGNP